MKLEQLRQPWMNDRLEIPTIFNDIITHASDTFPGEI